MLLHKFSFMTFSFFCFRMSTPSSRSREKSASSRPNVKSTPGVSPFWRFHNRPTPKVADNDSTIYLSDPLYAIEDLFLDLPCLPEGRPTNSIAVGEHVTIHTSKLPRLVISHLSIKGGEYTPVPLFFKAATHATPFWDSWVEELKS